LLLQLLLDLRQTQPLTAQPGEVPGELFALGRPGGPGG
jgi:hypothetical protein